MRLILLGAPGSGKGTVGEMIERAYGFPRVSTGDLLRKAVREGTPLGRRAEAVMASGALVSDEIVTAMVAGRIAAPDSRAGYILDGYPRTVGQAEALAQIDGGRPELVLALETSLDTLVERLSGRVVCPSCQAVYNTVRKPARQAGVCDVCGAALVQRPDDAAGVVRERIRVYEAATAPLKDYYRARSDYREIDGEGAPADVFARIAVVLDAAGAASGKRAER